MLAWWTTTTAFAADYEFLYTKECAQAYNHFMSLQKDKGKIVLQKSVREKPNNLMNAYIADYENFFELLLNGDPAILAKHRNQLTETIQLLSKGSSDDPYTRLTQAGTYLRWAIIYGRFGESFKAAISYRKAYQLIRENKQRFPQFAPNQVFYGICEAIAGAVPDEHKWLASMLGIKGDVRTGINRMLHYINSQTDNNAFLKAEATLAWCYLSFYLQAKKEQVWEYLQSGQFITKDNLLHCFIKANIALNYRKADEAINILRFAEQNFADYNRYPVLDYELGVALFHRLDPACIRYLSAYIQHHKSKLFIKDAWYMISLSWFLHGNIEKARAARLQILRSGSRITDADKLAHRFAEHNSWPQSDLLKVQLLCDGGYYSDALKILKSTPLQKLTTTADSANYFFREGRIYDETGYDALAIEAYRKTLRIGSKLKEHYAARAALQMGMIYEERGDMELAILSYRKCLSLKGHDFQASIDQQAKAGLNRLGK